MSTSLVLRQNSKVKSGKMSDTKFVAEGAIIVVAGHIQGEDGANMGPSLHLEMQGICEAMVGSREGLQQLQACLLEGVAALGKAMITAVRDDELPKGPTVVTAKTMPPLPKGFKLNRYH